MLRVVCIVQSIVPSTEISIIRPFNYLEKKNKISWQLIKESVFKAETIDHAEVVIFHRNCHPKCQTILNEVKLKKLPVIYEIDDNYFELPEELPIGRYLRHPIVKKTIETLLRSADIVKIGSPELQPIISKYNHNLVYQPYSVDFDLLKNMSIVNNPYLTIGYAGTINHCQDFRFMLNPIKQLTKEFPNIHWDFIGCAPEGMDKIPNYHYTPFIPDYASFLKELYRRNWQIGLSPVLDLPHNRCKTDNKLREYSACHIAGIYSNIPPYSLNVQPNRTGILVNNTEEAWYKAMKSLIENEHLRSSIADQAYQWVSRNRSVPVVANLWLNLFHEVLGKK